MRPDLSLLCLSWIVLSAACTGRGTGDSGAGVVDPGPPPDWLALGEVVPCPVALPGPAWQDEAAARGLGGLANPDGVHLNGGGAAIFDAEGDGDLDIVLAYPEAPPTLFRSEGGQFTAETLPGLSAGGGAVPWDMDGDGDLDLAVVGNMTNLVILRNDGGSFTDVTMQAMAPMNQGGLIRPAPADADGDGDIDLYMPQYQPSGTARGDFLLLNDGSGHLSPSPMPTATGAKSYDAVWLDADGDADLDIYITNDMGQQAGGNELYLSDGHGGFTRQTACDCAPMLAGMSVDAGDVDGDGSADIFLGNSDACSLYINDGAGSFYDAAVARGATQSQAEADPDMVWGAVLLDYDNDGDMDLYAAHGDLYSPDDPYSQRADVADALLSQQADGSFVDVAPELGLDSLESSRGVVSADLNADGVLDLLVTGIVSDPRLWISQGCTAEGWLEVEPGMIGARVAVTAGGRTHVAWSSATSSIFSGRATPVHLGLGAAQTVTALEIRYPDGRVLSTSVPFAARCQVTIVGD